MKAETTRNFEAGILTDDPEIVEQAMNGRSSERHPSLLEDARVVTDEDEVNQFDEVWIGKHYKSCKRRDFCPPQSHNFIENTIFIRPLPPTGRGLCLLCIEISF